MDRDKELDDAIRNWAETRARIAEMKAQLKELEDESTGAETYIVQVMEQLDREVRRVDNITVKVKKRQEGGRASYSQSFKFLYGKVNADLKRMADEFLDSTRGDKWLKTWLVIEQRQSLSEGIMKRVIDAIKGYAAMILDRLRGVSSDIDELEQMEKAQTESLRVAIADFLIESATG